MKIDYSLDQIRSFLDDKAFDNYASNLLKIDSVRNGIYHNRKGELPLTSITDDQDRLWKRMSWENLQPNLALERINATTDFQDISLLKKLTNHASNVGRIIIHSSDGIILGYGTGFLIGPRLLLTNNHVLQNVETAALAQVQFNYELDEDGRTVQPITFGLRPDLFFMTSDVNENPSVPYSGLDFTLVSIDSKGDDNSILDLKKYSRLSALQGKIIEGESCTIIQHPKGEFKKIVLKDIRMLTLTEKFLIYESDTERGSSGAQVIGLGTGEIIALHHASVPRKDAKGNRLLKSGGIASPNTPDVDIEWKGNEGIRISCIIEAIKNIEVCSDMEKYKNLFLETQQMITPKINEIINKNPMDASDLSKKVEVINLSKKNIQRFEVLLYDNENIIEDWDEKAKTLVKELLESTPLIYHSLDKMAKRMRYVKVDSSLPPFEIAALIEALPHVEMCTPDLSSYSDVGIDGSAQINNFSKSNIISKKGIGEINESEFLTQFGKSKWVTAAANISLPNKPKDYHRWWNWLAINCPHENLRNQQINNWDDIVNNVAQLRFTQLDTGYSHHSKVISGFNLTKDQDFIDQDSDAEDPMDYKLLWQFPGHGTRTSSIAIGTKLRKDSFLCEGNQGLLTQNTKPMVELIPYRIAKSVILFGQGKEMVDAADTAISNKSDVMFMCMGSYPRPMFDAIVREAYANGVIWVCAAGNNVEEVVAPAMYPGTIAVAAINPDDKPWNGSCNGIAVDISAPGESVYVPFIDKDGNEIMAFGSGTSYATPHVASAAMLWKARNLELFKTFKPWQIVEAFRYCLKKTARRPENWRTDRYGAGVLDLQKLLAYDMNADEIKNLKHAYSDKPMPPVIDLGIRETVHAFWGTVKRLITPGVTESLITSEILSARAKIALDMFKKPEAYQTSLEAFDLSLSNDDSAQQKLMKEYFKQYQK